jgi:ABC-2 type transport system permease protein
MTALWVARRVVIEIVRDHRTLAFFFVVPVVVMTLVYYALVADEVARVDIIPRGPSRMFYADLRDALQESEDVEVVSADIPDEESDPAELAAHFRRVLASGEVDGILYIGPELVPDRVELKRGTLHLYVEGTRPSKTALVLSGVKDATDALAEALPTVIDAECSAECAASVNAKPLDVEEHFSHGSSDNEAVDFFLPVLPPFFVFFFTFILSTITFQRERVRGTLERILVAPVSFLQVVGGYVAGFFAFAAVQATVVVAYFLKLTAFPVGLGQLGALAVIIGLSLVIALLLGLLASFVAYNEFQALQFIPLVILPQLFLSDIIWDIQTFPEAFRMISLALPLTYANVASRNILIRGETLAGSLTELLALAAFAVVFFMLLAIVGRRVVR